MLTACLALLLGLSAGNPYSALKMKDSWKEPITYDWEELDHAKAFKSWAKEFGKKYVDNSEEAHRFLVFRENWKLINEHNIRGDTNFTMGLNQFGDLTGEEFRYYVHGHGESCMQKRSVQERVAMHEVTPDVQAPTSVDWTTKGVVTPVKNQGQCGSCWAFSTTGSIESAAAIAGKALTSLSEQQLVDCSGSYGNQGCNGGLMDNAFKYVEANKGLCSEAEYGYTGRDGTCKSSSCKTIYDPISSYKDVTADSMSALETAVAMGPVSIAIEADQTAFQHYSSGVMSGTCGTRLDHGVLAVGYGTSGTSEYWKVKNSWGASWGMQGYILICKNCNKNNGKGECGILMEPSYPISA